MNIISDPTTDPQKGDVFFNKKLKKFKVFDGKKWKKLVVFYDNKPKDKFIFYSDRHVVISDYSYYQKNKQAIENWCELNCTNFHREGMVLVFNTPEERLMFAIRWAG